MKKLKVNTLKLGIPFFKKITPLVLVSILLVIVSVKVFAGTSTPSLSANEAKTMQFYWSDMEHITGKSGGQSVDFYDGNGFSDYSNHASATDKNTYGFTSPSSSCSVSSTVNGSAVFPGQIKSTYSLSYNTSGNGPTCQTYNSPNWDKTNTGDVVIQDSQNANVMYFISSDGNSVNRVDGNTSYVFNKAGPGTFLKTPGGNCSDELVITKNSDSNDNAIIFQLSTQDTGQGKAPAITQSTSCYIIDHGDDTYNLWNAGPQGGVHIHLKGVQADTPLAVPCTSNCPALTVTSQNTSSGSTSCTDTTGTGSCIQPNCEAAVSYFGWMLCPVIGKADSAYQWAKTLIYSLLNIDTSGVSKNDGLFKAWQTTKNLATAIIILIGVIMVGAQVLNVEVFSAYTVKKVLPRLIIATIGMQFSWYIFIALIDIFNAIGVGIYQLLINAFGATDAMGILGANATSNGVADTTTIVQNLVGGIAAGGAAVVGGVALIAAFASGAAEGAFLGLILVMVGALISILVTLVTLIIRKVAIIILLLLSPLALIAWVLPGTQSLWNKWWQNFIKLLGMFPLITLLFAAGAIGSKVVLIGASNGGDLSILRSFDVIIVIIVYFAPLFLIPKTFKFAGTAFAAMAGATAALGDKAKNSKRMTRAKEMVQKNKDASREYNRQQKGLKNMQSNNAFKKMRGRYQTGVFGASGAYSKKADTQLEKGAIESDYEVLGHSLSSVSDRPTQLATAKAQAANANGTRSSRIAATKWLAANNASDELAELHNDIVQNEAGGASLWASMQNQSYPEMKKINTSLVNDFKKDSSGNYLTNSAGKLVKNYDAAGMNASTLLTQDAGAVQEIVAEEMALRASGGKGNLDNTVIAQALSEMNPSDLNSKKAVELKKLGGSNPGPTINARIVPKND